MKYIFEELKLYKKEAILAPLFKMLEAFFDLFVPLVVAHVINVGITQKNYQSLYQGIGLLILLAVIGITCSITAQYFAAKASVKSATALRKRLYKHIQSFSFSEIDAIGTSTLITRMTSDINQIQNGINMTLRLLLRSPFIVVGSMVMAFVINRKIAIIFLIAILLLSVVIFFIMNKTSPVYQVIQKKLDRILLLTRENLTGVRVIRAFSNEAQEVKEFKEANDDFYNHQLRAGGISALLNPLTYVIVNLSIIAILYFGSQKVNSGVLLSGDIVALINYINQILVELIKLASTIVLISKTIASASRVEAILDTKPTMRYGPLDTLEKESPLIEFNHVSFTYPSSKEESISDLSFKIEEGQTVGIIGSTGSGKTTLAHLMTRFYDCSEGTVKLYNKDIKEYKESLLRNTIHIVMQKAQLFNGTIKSNLISGQSNISDEQLYQALEAAQAMDIIHNKENGLEEIVEQGGRNFSGGQRQRLSIARALASNCKLLILDDSSSALDYATDASLRTALSSFTPKLTTVIISQRTSSVRNADVILVLEDGRLVGIGTHEELLKSCEVYKEIDLTCSRGAEDE